MSDSTLTPSPSSPSPGTTWWTWFSRAPAERLAALRILSGGFALGCVLGRFLHFSDYSRFVSSQFRPIGVVKALGEPLSAFWTWSPTALCAVLGVAFLWGWRFRITGPLFALVLLWVTTYRSSWGMIFHTENLLVVHILILAFVPSADAWSLDARRARKAGRPLAVEGVHSERYGWPIRLMCAVAALTYFIAGVAKFKASGSGWMGGDVLRIAIARDAVTKLELGSIHSPLGGWMASMGWMFPPLAFLTILLEVGAPFAVFSRRLGYVWVAGIWGFHLGVTVMMAILFPYTLFMFGFASFFEAERWVLKLRSWLPKKAQHWFGVPR